MDLYHLYAHSGLLVCIKFKHRKNFQLIFSVKFYLDLFAIGETGSSSESEMNITLLSCGEAGAGGANVSCPASVFISEISELRVS